jgi:SpoU rRNA methylase family enzyme
LGTHDEIIKSSLDQIRESREFGNDYFALGLISKTIEIFLKYYGLGTLGNSSIGDNVIKFKELYDNIDTLLNNKEWLVKEQETKPIDYNKSITEDSIFMDLAIFEQDINKLRLVYENYSVTRDNGKYLPSKAILLARIGQYEEAYSILLKCLNYELKKENGQINKIRSYIGNNNYVLASALSIILDGFLYNMKGVTFTYLEREVTIRRKDGNN